VSDRRNTGRRPSTTARLQQLQDERRRLFDDAGRLRATGSCGMAAAIERSACERDGHLLATARRSAWGYEG